MRWSHIPRWKFTDSCGRPGVAGAVHVGCAHDAHACHHATRRGFLKGGVAIVGAAGIATIVDQREAFAQVRVFPPPPPAVSPIAGKANATGNDCKISAYSHYSYDYALR